MTPAADLRTTFDEDAERYNRFRPQYPSELFTQLIQETKITNASKLVEIGPGTGQATRPLAEIGADITGIELGKELADKARSELQRYPNVRIITSPFEDADLPSSNYDLIYSATAFHWIRDEYKFTKTAALLKPHGHLAIIHTEHVADGDGDKFYRASRSIYDRYWPPRDSAQTALPAMDQLKAPAIDGRLFEFKSFDIFLEAIVYSAEDYAGLLSTYSPTIALPAGKRQAFLTDIAALINEEFGGKLEKTFAFTLTIAQKKPQLG